MSWTERRGPKEAPYDAVLASLVEQLLGCADRYKISEVAAENAVVADAAGGGGEPLGQWMRKAIGSGYGLVLMVPPDAGAAASSAPARQGLDLFCDPDPSFNVVYAAVATKSVNEAQRVLAGGGVVVVEPASGWLELVPAKASVLSWPRLALGLAAVAVVSYLVLRTGK